MVARERRDGLFGAVRDDDGGGGDGGPLPPPPRTRPWTAAVTVAVAVGLCCCNVVFASPALAWSLLLAQHLLLWALPDAALRHACAMSGAPTPAALRATWGAAAVLSVAVGASAAVPWWRSAAWDTAVAPWIAWGVAAHWTAMLPTLSDGGIGARDVVTRMVAVAALSAWGVYGVSPPWDGASTLGVAALSAATVVAAAVHVVC